MSDHGAWCRAGGAGELRRCSADFDTSTLAGLAYGQTVLAKACQAANMDFDNRSAHSALYDAVKTAELFCGIVNRWKDLGGWPLETDAESE